MSEGTRLSTSSDWNLPARLPGQPPLTADWTSLKRFEAAWEALLMETPAILVVDDTPVSVGLARSVLETVGFRTLTATDGPPARALCHAGQPDLILLDVMTPGEAVFETYAHLKPDPATTDIPIIFLPAVDDVRNKVAGLKIGGVDHVAKPVHGEEVLARVRGHHIRETVRERRQKSRRTNTSCRKCSRI